LLNTPDDIDLFKQSFREEAREILVDLESALLELNENHGDSELVSRVFRGLHTIKGSGAMFGFEELAAFTHNIETAFDAVRNGRVEINGELIDLTLGALDQIRCMLEAKEGAEPAWGRISRASARQSPASDRNRRGCDARNEGTGRRAAGSRRDETYLRVARAIYSWTRFPVKRL
jgi:chemotaxis protein histidine kinase CheA